MSLSQPEIPMPTKPVTDKQNIIRVKTSNNEVQIKLDERPPYAFLMNVCSIPSEWRYSFWTRFFTDGYHCQPFTCCVRSSLTPGYYISAPSGLKPRSGEHRATAFNLWDYEGISDHRPRENAKPRGNRFFGRKAGCWFWCSTVGANHCYLQVVRFAGWRGARTLHIALIIANQQGAKSAAWVPQLVMKWRAMAQNNI